MYTNKNLSYRDLAKVHGAANCEDISIVDLSKELDEEKQKQVRDNLGMEDYDTFSDISHLKTSTSEKLLYNGDKDIVIEDDYIKVNDSVKEIDFDGAVIRFTGELKYADSLKGHSACRLKNVHCILDRANGKDEAVCVSGFGYVENVTAEASATTYQSVKNVGFKNCDHLYNCKVYGGGTLKEIGFATGFSYCNYLIWCRYKGNSELDTTAFTHCNFISQCYMSYGQNVGANYSLGTNSHVESLIGILKDGSFEVFSDTDHLTVNGYSLDNFIKTLSSNGGTGKTKLYAKPDDKSGIATVLLDTDAVNWAVARRGANGTLKAKDAVADNDLVTLKQLNARIAELEAKIKS